MKKLRMLIVGAGTWGETHAKIFQEHPYSECVGICDTNLKKAEELAQKTCVSKVFSTIDEALSYGDFDAVSIVTPDHLHADISIRCAQAGKHILIEKPLAITKEDVFRILDAVRKYNVRAMVDLHNRWSPPFAAAKQAIDENKLGTIRNAYFRLNDIKWVATDLLPWASRSSILWFLGSHSFDTLQWLFNDQVTKVYSVSSRGVLDELGINTEDVYLTILEFSKGGIAQMENGWITPNANPCVNDIKCNICGSRGMIAIDASNHNLIQQYTDDQVIVPDILVRNNIHEKVKGFAYESIRSFVDCVYNQKPFIVSIEEAARVSIGILAIMESAKTREPVKVDYTGI